VAAATAPPVVAKNFRRDSAALSSLISLAITPPLCDNENISACPARFERCILLRVNTEYKVLADLEVAEWQFTEILSENNQKMLYQRQT
jgi:hypothetical protein